MQNVPRWRVPDFVWIVPVILVLLFFFGGLYLYKDALYPAMGIVLWWLKAFFLGGIVLLVLRLLYLGYEHYHDFHLKRYARHTAKHRVKKVELQNSIVAAQAEMIQQLPQVMQYAMQAGLNIEVTAKGDVKVMNHRIHDGVITAISEQGVPQITSGYLPEPYKMSDVLSNFTPSKDAVLLAKSQELITVPLGESLCHTTFTGNTDAGKTNNERMLLIQLASLEQCVYLCDRNYQPFRMDKKQNCIYDYTPIQKMLACEPITETKEAVALLKYLYSVVEERRLERRKLQSANAIVPFRDIYLFFDELPAFAGEDRDIMLYIGRLLREARQYGVFFIGAAQDLLNTTLSSDNGAIRDNLLTNYYGGGDMTTARMVLNLAKGERIDETGLGVKGITYLRAKGAQIERIKARTPWCDDLATHMLLDDHAPTTQTAIPRVVESDLVEQDDTEIAGDLRTVYNAVQDLLEDSIKVSARSIAEETGFGKDKSNILLNELEERGLYTRRLASNREEKTPLYIHAERQTTDSEVRI